MDHQWKVEYACSYETLLNQYLFIPCDDSLLISQLHYVYSTCPPGIDRDTNTIHSLRHFFRPGENKTTIQGVNIYLHRLISFIVDSDVEITIMMNRIWINRKSIKERLLTIFGRICYRIY